MPLSSLPFSVLHTSGRPCYLSSLPFQYSQSVSYKDFCECFPLWCEEQPNGAEGIFNTVSSFIETHIVVRCSPHSLPSSISTQLKLPLCLPSRARYRFILHHSSVMGWERKTNTNKLFEQYDVQKNVDILHQVVTEARTRRKRGQTVPAASGDIDADTWRADLQPRAAVRARTIPALERERDSLRARLAEVRLSVMSSHPPVLL